jgi:hypothetical protein
MSFKKCFLCCALLGLSLLFTTNAKADSTAFVGENNGDFGTIDLNTGSFTKLGNSGLTLAGMAVANGELFGTSYHQSTGTLYEINPANGSVTTVGVPSSVDIDDFGSTTSGLYAVGFGATQDLYSINPTTGAATLIGPTGLSYGSWRSLSTNSSTLYFSDGADLYTLNTTTGAATLVGPLGGSSEIGAMVFENGTLWGGQNEGGIAVDTINPTTGAATEGPAPSSPFDSTFFALAPSPIPTSGPPGVPEPSSLIMLASGLFALLPTRKRLSRNA